ALRQRFEIDEIAIPKLHQWVEEAGIRWGLNARQRAQTVAMPTHLEANTWQTGLRRMLLGYAVGAGAAFNGIEPYEEIGGLEAQWLGGLSFLLETLEKYSSLLRQDQASANWQSTLLALLEDFFVVSNEPERKTLETLIQSLAGWTHNCEQAGLTEADTLPLNVVRESWLAAVDEPSLHQRFLSGRVNFCTLMPMRAIPFRLICLLGMNDGDYPRSQQAQSFDLMTQRGHYRPGDRSRRQDDQYLFMEALLSARQQLYISWVGRNIRDNSERPPSVLISQLRDTLEQGWRLADNSTTLLSEITVAHPLQPFSRQYVVKNRDRRLFTYAREWFDESRLINAPSAITPPTEKTLTLSLESLARFLKAPVKTFCNHTLKFGFDDETSTSEDNEPFAFNRLESYVLSNELLTNLKSRQPTDTATFFAEQRKTLAGKGKLPLSGFAQAAFAEIASPVNKAWLQYQAQLNNWPDEILPRAINLSFILANGISVQLTGDLNNLRQHHDNQRVAMLQLTAQRLLNKDNIKYPNLLLNWVQHLAGCADGLPLQTLVIGADTVISIAPIEPDVALAQLASLIQAWHLGMQEPLPVACKTAFAWLGAAPEKALDTAQAQYQGDDWNNGEVDYDAYLARFFPTFAGLKPEDLENGFVAWADTLYRSAFTHITQQDVQS
ncbi:MAG: exodeoxyribonuclease V subunit gamma, partial [Methylococcaceae bacterium]|nr:exodeoxyribonuclease V subunit gamma [Methylococcaceae bacterium]